MLRLTLPSLSSILIVFAALLLASECSEVPYRRWPAAKCVALSRKCHPYVARRSGVCKPHVRAPDQSSRCRKAACEWCQYRGRLEHEFCKSPVLRRLCKLGRTPRTQPPTTTFPDRKCTWTATGENVVIDLSIVKAARGWSPVSRAGFNGIVYEANKTHGIDPEGEKGRMCFWVRPKLAGDYYFTVLSFSPHPTEHNDGWFQSKKGFALWQGSTFWRHAGPEEWLKGYQNNGDEGISTSLYTKDHDGHRFIIEDLKAGGRFRVCTSGRSYMYEMFRIILAKCASEACKHGVPSGLKKISPSKCLL